MIWMQEYFPLKLGFGLNRVVVYVQLLKYLLMCRVLLMTESSSFGGNHWEKPWGVYQSIAENYRYWAGCNLFLFKRNCGYGNALDFDPNANDGKGGFTVDA